MEHEILSNVAHGGQAGFLGVAYRDRAYVSAVVKYPRVRQAVFSPYSLDVEDEDRRESNERSHVPRP